MDQVVGVRPVRRQLREESYLRRLRYAIHRLCGDEYLRSVSMQLLRGGQPFVRALPTRAQRHLLGSGPRARSGKQPEYAGLGGVIGVDPFDRYQSILANVCDQAFRLVKMVDEFNIKLHLGVDFFLAGNFRQSDFIRVKSLACSKRSVWM